MDESRITCTSMSHVYIQMSHVSLMNESCPTYKWDLLCTNEWVTAYVWMDESCITYVCIDESCLHTNESCLTYEWVMSHLRMSHVPRMNESNITFVWMNHVPRMNKRVTSHYKTNETCLTYASMSHVSLMNESCLTYEWVMSLYR